MRPLALILSVLALLAAPAALRAESPAPAASPAPAPAPPPAPAPAPAPVPAPAAATLTPAQAQGVLDVLQDDAKRQAFVATLQNMVRALPAEAAAPAKPAVMRLAPNSLGARLLLQLSTGVEQVGGEVASTAAAVNDVPLLVAWAQGLAADPTARASMWSALWRLAVVVACAGAGQWAVWRLLARPRQMLDARAPADGVEPHDEAADLDEAGATGAQGRGRRLSVAWRMLRRLPYVLLNLVLNVLPVAAFAALGNVLLGTRLGDSLNARLVVIAVVNAYVACCIVMCVTRMLVAPDAPRLRLVQCSDDTAAYVERWMRRLAAVAVFGFAITEVGLLFGLYRSAHDVVIKFVALVVHVMLVIIVLQKRHAVELRLRARRRAAGTLVILQNQLAARWHAIAIFYIVALWLVAAAEIRDGYTRLLHFFVVTFATVVVARLVGIVLLGGVDRGFHSLGKSLPSLEQRVLRYEPVVRACLSVLLFSATFVVLLEAWGFSPLGWFGTGNLGGQVLSAVVTSTVTIVVAALIWEAANVSVENHLAGLTRQAQVARAARLRTLLPMLRTALLVGILIVAGLIVLSQVGVNVAPLLAGAGVLGVAIGFGSQKLVQDLITGLFLLLENTMQVGDTVALGGLTGKVETLSIRTIRLRALDGSVHIIPFSSVTTVTNQTRDFSYALMDVPVGLNEEPDRVADVLKEIARDMRAEPRWQDAMTSELEVMGVNGFGDNAFTMRVRVRTEPAERWAVMREFNRRMKYRFDAMAIQSPMTAWRVQGWLPPGAERPMSQPGPQPGPPEDAVPRATQ